MKALSFTFGVIMLSGCAQAHQDWSNFPNKKYEWHRIPEERFRAVSDELRQEAVGRLSDREFVGITQLEFEYFCKCNYEPKYIGNLYLLRALYYDGDTGSGEVYETNDGKVMTYFGALSKRDIQPKRTAIVVNLNQQLEQLYVVSNLVE